MKKILVISNSAKGLYNFRQELLKELTLNSKVIVSVPDAEQVKDIENLSCEVIKTPVDRRGINFLKDFKLLMTYMRILKEVKPDVVLTYTIKPNIYGGIACRLKKVSQLANITGLGTAVENGGLLKKILIFMYKIAMKKTKCIFFQNETNMNIFKNYKIVKDNYRLIPGSGVNLTRFPLEEYPKNDVTKFLFVGRIMKTKGIEEFLEAARTIKGKYNSTEFVILGSYDEDKYKEKIEEYVKKDIVKYKGFQSDVRKYMVESNCLILPSYFEGLANVLLEAAATGRPIIASNIPGCKETIDNGENGYLVEVKSVDSLVEKIERILNLSYEEQREMGLKGRRKVEKEFDRNIVVNAYMEEINL